MAEAFYVLFKDGPPKDWSRAAEIVFSAGVGLGRADATKACRFGQGLLTIPLTEERAKTLALALENAKFPALALPHSKITEVPQAYSTSSAAPDAAGFHIQVDAHGKVKTLPWESIRIVNVVYIKPGGGCPKLPSETIVVPEMSKDDNISGSSPVASAVVSAIGLTAATLALGPLVGSTVLTAQALEGARSSLDAAHDPFYGDPSLAEQAAQPKGPEVRLELFTLEPLFRLRIHQKGFRYDYLGTRRMPNARGNFKLLVADILKYTPTALRINQATVAGSGANVEQDKLLLEEPVHELSLMVLLTRAMLGLS